MGVRQDYDRSLQSRYDEMYGKCDRVEYDGSVPHWILRSDNDSRIMSHIIFVRPFVIVIGQNTSVFADVPAENPFDAVRYIAESSLDSLAMRLRYGMGVDVGYVDNTAVAFSDLQELYSGHIKGVDGVWSQIIDAINNGDLDEVRQILIDGGVDDMIIDPTEVGIVVAPRVYCARAACRALVSAMGHSVGKTRPPSGAFAFHLEEGSEDDGES